MSMPQIWMENPLTSTANHYLWEIRENEKEIFESSYKKSLNEKKKILPSQQLSWFHLPSSVWFPNYVKNTFLI